MVEETEAVENLEAILAVPGVDVIHVAAGDLGQSMGNPGPAAVRQLMSEVVPKIRAGGKNVGVGGILQRLIGSGHHGDLRVTATGLVDLRKRCLVHRWQRETRHDHDVTPQYERTGNLVKLSRAGH